MPAEPEVAGLLALILLLHARHAARMRGDGALVPLAEQDRGLWNASLIAEGQGLVRGCLRRAAPGPYQIQAAIQAVHSEGSTDWRQVLQLYDQLLAIQPSPVAALNRAVALAEVAGPAAALCAVEALDIPGYHLVHAVRADLLRRLGRYAEAAEAYGVAGAGTANAAERAYLAARRDQALREANPPLP
jgi:RNA polymerase sigma-70 factor (ECF subfamily)